MPKENTPLSHKSSTATIDMTLVLTNNNDIFSVSANKGPKTWGGGIFLSKDNGNNWSAANDGLPDAITVNTLTIIGTNIYCGTNGGGVWMRPLTSFTK